MEKRALAGCDKGLHGTRRFDSPDGKLSTADTTRCTSGAVFGENIRGRADSDCDPRRKKKHSAPRTWRKKKAGVDCSDWAERRAPFPLRFPEPDRHSSDFWWTTCMKLPRPVSSPRRFAFLPAIAETRPPLPTQNFCGRECGAAFQTAAPARPHNWIEVIVYVRAGQNLFSFSRRGTHGDGPKGGEHIGWRPVLARCKMRVLPGAVCHCNRRQRAPGKSTLPLLRILAGGRLRGGRPRAGFSDVFGTRDHASASASRYRPPHRHDYGAIRVPSSIRI